MDTNRYKLLIMPRAASDLENIYDYIEHEADAPKTAFGLMLKIEKSFMRLCDMPESCPLCQDKLLAKKGYRKLVVARYIALYTVDKDKKNGYDYAVVHERQNYGRFV